MLRLLEDTNCLQNVCWKLFIDGYFLNISDIIFNFLDVIHTVGPKGEKPEDLRNCYRTCLKLMVENKLRTIAFPCISTGIYGYPVEPAAHIATYEVRKHLEEHADKVDRIIFCVFLEDDADIYEGVMQSYFPLH